MGDGRGHWEGNTLVVDTTNLNAKSRLDVVGDFYSPNAHIVERFIFNDATTMTYEATITDPTVFTRPWTLRVQQRRMADETISLESIMQRGRDRRPHGGEDPRSVDKPAAVALVTYATSEDAVRRALAAIERDGVLAEKPQVIRIEKS